MQWYEKFKVGQQVKIVQKIVDWQFTNGGGCSWTGGMDKSVGKVFKIIEIDKDVGYRLNTQLSGRYDDYKYDYYYPVESLVSIGGQLLFSFYTIK